MKFRFGHLALLAPFLLTGCIFHKKQAQPVRAFAPAISTVPKPEPVHPDLPESATTISEEPLDSTADADLPSKPVTHPHHPLTKPPLQAVDNPPTPATDLPAVSAMGQLSSGEPANLRYSVEESITSTEHGIDNIGRPLNDQEKKTAAQIREFLKQAKDALSAGDVIGARNLASKAKVLLTELNQ
jgi:hypothetical protein